MRIIIFMTMVMGACGLMVVVIRGMGSFHLIKYYYKGRPQSSELGFSLWVLLFS